MMKVDPYVFLLLPFTFTHSIFIFIIFFVGLIGDVTTLTQMQ